MPPPPPVRRVWVDGVVVEIPVGTPTTFAVAVAVVGGSFNPLRSSFFEKLPVAVIGRRVTNEGEPFGRPIEEVPVAVAVPCPVAHGAPPITPV